MVQLRQGDGNYQSLSVTVTSNGEPFDLTGWTTTFMGTTAGGFKIVDAASVVTNALQGEFTYTPTKAWGQDQGEFKNAYFKFTKADETASGASFRVNVLDAVDLTAEEAQDYISVVDALIDNVKTSIDNKLAETKQTLADTQSQANTVQTNVNDLNTSVNDLKTQNLNIKTTDNTWTGTNTFNNKIITTAGVQGNSDTTTKLQTARLVGGVPFDGTSDIALPGVNVKGNQDTSGRADNATNADHANNASNADLATKAISLQTPRKINGINFDGTSDINVNAANDSSLVHVVGNETIAGDKTFTGNNTFTGKTSFWFKQIKWTSGIMQGTWYIQRMGNFVFARFEKSQSTGTGNTSLFLPVGYRPINNWILETERGQAGINGNGNVFIGTAYNDNVSMTFVYPTNDVWPTA